MSLEPRIKISYENKNNDLNKNNEKVINNIIFKFSETKYPAYSYLKSFKNLNLFH